MATSAPKISALPVLGEMSPISMRMTVVLPEPFGPRKPTTSPGCTSKDTESTPSDRPYHFVSEHVRMAGALTMQGWYVPGVNSDRNRCHLHDQLWTAVRVSVRASMLPGRRPVTQTAPRTRPACRRARRARAHPRAPAG